MAVRELTCIGCPVGCSLEVEIRNGKVINVQGNICIKGKNYAEKECTNPTRIVTSSVPVLEGEVDILSVKTQKDIPKEKIFECIKDLKGIIVKAPIEIGDIIVENTAGTGVNVVATKKIEKAIK
ncbi:DUF1667 domain-containing protein [Clostridium ganghwense]|uniref:DUF1667 domain-containing protein n=1 Tax=Clostridium ganghwense TaxID=312089 RepID=A0ABT4CUL4_9CLOT|nr:DUF1667 domain-containing protein [Clostridium ganghwense]MCY6372747.1 DUF1667 domain-containing protein [Clostridium ganghwense]